MKSFILINTRHTLVSFQYLRSPSVGELRERACMVFSSLCLATLASHLVLGHKCRESSEHRDPSGPDLYGHVPNSLS